MGSHAIPTSAETWTYIEMLPFDAMRIGLLGKRIVNGQTYAEYDQNYQRQMAEGLDADVQAGLDELVEAGAARLILVSDRAEALNG